MFLFVLPGILATRNDELSVVNISFVGTLFFFFWVTITEFAYQSAAATLNLKRKRLFLSLDLHQYERGESDSGFRVMKLVSISYLSTVYGFAIIYTFMSNIDILSFSTENQLTLIDSLYFSLVTSSTVGYGDILPKSGMAKSVVMLQILVSMAYVIMLFSSVVSYIQSCVEKP
ncbi:potassium channel family protein [Aliivibrio salmonicida]|uniref:potassium channel family protein n=1 Tax=Aliivibrio salmonicida TaxID=40269 RepID=UPI00406D08ED